MSEQESTGFQPAAANRVRALETNVLHASDVLYWLDATSASEASAMQRLGHALNIRFDEKPVDVKVLNSAGRTALWRAPQDPMIDGYASEAQRTREAQENFSVSGAVVDDTGRYNPRLFNATLGSGEGVGIELFPSLARVAIPTAGAVHGHLQFNGDDAAAAWALLELEVTVATAQTEIFRAQADGKGDFILTLNRLPPLPESISQYDAVLRVSADASLTVDDVPDTNEFVAMTVESLSVVADFQTELALAIVPGVNTRINSFNKQHIAIQPA